MAGWGCGRCDSGRGQGLLGRRGLRLLMMEGEWLKARPVPTTSSDSCGLFPAYKSESTVDPFWGDSIPHGEGNLLPRIEPSGTFWIPESHHHLLGPSCWLQEQLASGVSWEQVGGRQSKVPLFQGQH